MNWPTSHYNLICQGYKGRDIFSTQSGVGKFARDRLFEYTNDTLASHYDNHLRQLAELPTLIVAEAMPNGNDWTPARLSRIDNIREDGKNVVFDYRHLQTAEFSSEEIFGLGNLDFGDWEHSRTHWAVKEGDLIARLLEFFASRETRQRPTFFNVTNWPMPTLGHVAVMMPFKSDFDPVYGAIKAACDDVKLPTLRVDEIIRPTKIIDDIFSSIVQSSVMICDLTGANPNVLYETGIAHARNCKVILIVQDKRDVPFDLRQNRFLTYFPNSEGLEKLRQDLRESLRAIRS